jgi:hypothetical protein
MPEEIISTASPAGQAIDSLSANEFAVELENTRAAGIFRVTGLIPFKLDVKPSLTKIVSDPFKIVKLVQRDPALPFNRWVRETIQAKDDIVRPLRIVDIIALDDGQETRRWKVKGAWISEISYSDFDTGSSELVQETLTIHYDEIEEVWGSAAANATSVPSQP